MKREPTEEEREKIGALSVTLSEEELAALETPYVPPMPSRDSNSSCDTNPENRQKY